MLTSNTRQHIGLFCAIPVIILTVMSVLSCVSSGISVERALAIPRYAKQQRTSTQTSFYAVTSVLFSRVTCDFLKHQFVEEQHVVIREETSISSAGRGMLAPFSSRV